MNHWYAGMSISEKLIKIKSVLPILRQGSDATSFKTSGLHIHYDLLSCRSVDREKDR